MKNLSSVETADMEIIADKVRLNRPLTRLEVMAWCEWSAAKFYNSTKSYHGRDFLNYQRGVVLPTELNRYLSGQK